MSTKISFRDSFSGSVVAAENGDPIPFDGDGFISCLGGVGSLSGETVVLVVLPTNSLFLNASV